MRKGYGIIVVLVIMAIIVLGVLALKLQDNTSQEHVNTSATIAAVETCIEACDTQECLNSCS